MSFSCVYKIMNLTNGKIYVGSTIDFEKRKKQHIRSLINNKHHSRYLQYSWNLYGKNEFIFEILEENLSKEDILKREQYWIDTLAPEYNICKFAGNCLGIKISDESKEKMRKSNIGKYDGENNPFYGKKHSENTRKKISEARKGKYVGNENHMHGRQHSEETKQKISLAQIGKRAGENHHMFGKKHTEETRKKISLSQIGKRVGEKSPSYGKHLSEETKQKIRNALKGRKGLNGEDAYSSKLTWKEVDEIREKYIPRIYSLRKLAAEYNVSYSTIEDVVKFKRWIK